MPGNLLPIRRFEMGGIAATTKILGRPGAINRIP
jgi:hypothetical protein